jgi:ribosomal protein L12E/L44/L45/RPP1/RPP2
LTWAKNQEESLRRIKKLTGLDVDSSKIKGWVDFLEEKHKELLSEEQSHFTDNRDYSDYFKDYDL